VEEREPRPAVDRTKRQALLDEIEQHFDVKLLWFKRLPSPGHRDDVTTHAFFDPDRRLTDDLKLEIRCRMEGQGWQFSRQMVPVLGNDAQRREHVYLAPMIRVAAEVGYHATRRASVPSIMERGLLPSAPERQTTESRWDCEGNIFLCENLGTPADAGVRGSGSAHWWLDHLAHNNRFGDPDWVILRVEVGRLKDARVYQDVWSESGVIVGGIAALPPEVIELEYAAR
jgi:hypothetical protein